MRKLLLAMLMSIVLSTQVQADIDMWGSVLSFTKSAIIKTAGVSGLEGLALQIVVEEVVTEENINAAVEIAEGKKAYRNDLGAIAHSDFPSSKYVKNYRNY